jgi:hypothetical protein
MKKTRIIIYQIILTNHLRILELIMEYSNNIQELFIVILMVFFILEYKKYIYLFIAMTVNYFLKIIDTDLGMRLV